MTVQVSASPKDPNEKKFASGMTVERARNQEIRQGDPKRGFRPDEREGAKGRTGDVVSEVDVADGGKDGVEGRREDLQRVRRFHRVGWSVHLGHEDEEHEVAGVGEDGLESG